jgi:hypothetical protein
MSIRPLVLPLAILICTAPLAACGDSPTTGSSSASASIDGRPSCPATACSLLQESRVHALFGPGLGPAQAGPEITGEVSLSSCSYTSSQIPVTAVTLQVRCAPDAEPDVAAVRGTMTTMFGKAPAAAGDAARPALWGSKPLGAGGTSGEYYVFAAGGVQIAVSVLTGLTDAVARSYSEELARDALEAAGQGR